jgi:excisionase family DNA binding protein
MNYLSTGQASKSLSVTPDTILKWIKQGRISALRTPGGHYRISREDINVLLNQTEQTTSSTPFPPSEKGLLYCWEFFAGEGEVKQGCLGCLVYRAQALKCFEMNHLSMDVGFKGMSNSSSCEKCSYFRYQLGRPFKVLVITDNDTYRESLLSEGKRESIRLQFASCEYECSLLIDRFRPDFVVVDCAMLEEKCRELCHHLANDPRIQGSTIFLATPARRLSISFPGTLRIRHPFTLEDLMNYFRDKQVCRSIQVDQGCVITGGRH